MPQSKPPSVFTKKGAAKRSPHTIIQGQPYNLR